MARGATFAARWLYGHKPISNRQVGLGFPHLAGRCRPGGSAFSSPGCRTCRDMERFLIREYEIIPPGCTGTSALAREPTFAARWLHERQQKSHHPVGLGVPHPAGRYRLGGSAFSSPVCWICTDTERFLIRGREFILPGFGGTSALARGATFAAGWLHGHQPISNCQVGLGFPHPAGRYRPGGSAFSSAVCWT